ncbi:hypothetical protein RI367_008170 [Sorochytrium milnesiophthora]
MAEHADIVLAKEDSATSTAATQPTAEADPQQTAADAEAPAQPPMGKRAMKRALKAQNFEVYKMAKRQKEREKRKEKNRQKRELIEQAMQGVHVEASPRNRVNPDQQPSGVRIVFDLDFEGKMTEKEAKSMCDQLRYCYAANRRCARSVELVATSCTGTIKALLDTKQADHKNWKGFQFYDNSYLDHYDAASLVYLTADSPNVLTEFEPAKTYIIGGIVDHNRHKSLCLERATAQGIAHAQLPISEYVKLNSRRVLTVNHCVEIIVKVLENDYDWRQAFTDVIPERKLESKAATASAPPTLMSRLQRLLGYGVPSLSKASAAAAAAGRPVQVEGSEVTDGEVEVAVAAEDASTRRASVDELKPDDAISTRSRSDSVSDAQVPADAKNTTPANRPPLTETHAKTNVVLPWYEYRPVTSSASTAPSSATPYLSSIMSSIMSALPFTAKQPKRLTSSMSNLPPELSKVAIIGVHGWFYMKIVQKVIGEPTGTSQKFCDRALTALETWTQQHYGTSLPPHSVTKIPLEVEGKIESRVERMYRNITNRDFFVPAEGWARDVSFWQATIQEASTVFVATHSQGTPVSILLLEKLIDSGVIDPARQKVVVLAQAGISHGPFPYMLNNIYVRYFESDAARQLFEFNNPSAAITRRYCAAMERILESGARVVLVSSWLDQVVPLYSSAFHAISHPNLYRSVFIDSENFYENDFLPHLVIFAIKLRNHGLSDYDLLVHLSDTVAGSVYSGTQGHSTLYEEPDVYTLAINFLLSAPHDPSADEPPQAPFMRRLSQSLYLPFVAQASETESTSDSGSSQPHSTMAFQMSDFQPPTKLNSYYLPWILHSIIADPNIRSHPVLSHDLRNLLDMFHKWEVGGSKVRKELQYRLEPLMKARL